MKFSLDKVLSAFGNKTAIKPEQAGNYFEDIINSVDGDAFAISEHNVLFAKTSELGGYFYVITIIVGRFKIKTNKGAKLSIEGHDFDLVLNSDMDEFESDHSNVAKRYITRIDFQIEEADVANFDKSAITTLKLTAKKQEILFNTL